MTMFIAMKVKNQPSILSSTDVSVCDDLSLMIKDRINNPHQISRLISREEATGFASKKREKKAQSKK